MPAINFIGITILFYRNGGKWFSGNFYSISANNAEQTFDDIDKCLDKFWVTPLDDASAV